MFTFTSPTLPLQEAIQTQTFTMQSIDICISHVNVFKLYELELFFRTSACLRVNLIIVLNIHNLTVMFNFGNFCSVLLVCTSLISE